MIYDFQRPVYDKLRQTASAIIEARKHHLNIRPRFHRLIIGPSGTGKTHLSRTLGHELNWRVLDINVGSWIVLGAREKSSWSVIIEWLCEPSAAPRIIVLDEIDKITDDTSWNRHLRAELFDLLDGRIPNQAVPEECDYVTAYKRMHTTMIIGAGAFQDAFEKPPSMGFVPTEDKPSTSDDIAKHMQRELVNRFSSEILVLPELQEKDYQDMLVEASKELPNEVADAILSKKSIAKEAARDKMGARFVENIISGAFYEISRGKDPVPWSPAPFAAPKIEPDPFQVEGLD
jgi:SpoVK/Ycf46/Vps4 family AAA+-type ATPase